MKQKKILFLYVLSLVICSGLQAQHTPSRLDDARELKRTGHFSEALTLFKEFLKSDSSNLEYLCQTGFLYCKLGPGQSTEPWRQFYFKNGRYLAQKAIALDSNNATAHYIYALALGRLNENVSNKEKIANAKLIKNECDRSLQLDPRNGSVYHILGRWHRTIAGFNVLEKLAISTLYGGLPEGGTYDDAINCFMKAIQMEPLGTLHYYELAQTYVQRDKKDDKIFARVWLEKALNLPWNLFDPDDETIRKKCELLLNRLK